MAKKITDKPIVLKTNKVYPRNEKPYELMIKWLTDGKTEKEKKEIIDAFHESHTYLLICEEGYTSPPYFTLKYIYEEEKKNGLVGFVKALKEEIPTFFD